MLRDEWEAAPDGDGPRFTNCLLRRVLTVSRAFRHASPRLIANALIVNSLNGSGQGVFCLNQDFRDFKDFQDGSRMVGGWWMDSERGDKGHLCLNQDFRDGSRLGEGWWLDPEGGGKWAPSRGAPTIQVVSRCFDPIGCSCSGVKGDGRKLRNASARVIVGGDWLWLSCYVFSWGRRCWDGDICAAGRV